MMIKAIRSVPPILNLLISSHSFQIIASIPFPAGRLRLNEDLSDSHALSL